MTKKLLMIIGILMTLTLIGLAQDAMKKDRGVVGIKTLEGKVGEINSTKIVVENDFGAKREIPLDDKTKFQTGTKSAKLDDVKAGSKVRVSFRESDRVATLIAVDFKEVKK